MIVASFPGECTFSGGCSPVGAKITPTIRVRLDLMITKGNSGSRRCGF